MSLNEIKESGLLELYILGKLSDTERIQVEEAIVQFPELKKELFEIEKALFNYDNLFRTAAPSNALNNIMNDLGLDEKSIGKESNSNLWKIFSGLLGLLFITSLIYFIDKVSTVKEELNKKEIAVKECDDEKLRISEKLDLQTEILQYQTDKIRISPTEKYPDTELIIHSNPDRKKNYLQIKNLPPLAENQSFQLWSLKGDSAPIPLDVFEDNVNEIFEIAFEDNTNAYAITIEPRGGQDSPTLENLIGVFALGS